MISLPDFRYQQIVVHVAGGSGEKLKFRCDNLVVEDKEGEVVLQHSCHRTFALFVIGEISLTSVLVQKAVQYAFPIVLMNRNLHVTARINSGAEGNTLLRRIQYGQDEAARLDIARELIRQKIANQAALLGRLRHLSREDREAKNWLDAVSISGARNGRELMGMEGNASRTFFSAYFRPLDWIRREPRCKRDIPNLLLDIGYTWLFNFMDALLGLYGFDPYCGVLHTFFYQRKSLVCDMVEPFRCIIDQRLRKAHALRQIHKDDFFVQDGQYRLEWKKQAHYAKLFFKDILQHKEDMFRYCQDFYRWLMRGRTMAEFPKFKIGGNDAPDRVRHPE